MKNCTNYTGEPEIVKSIRSARLRYAGHIVRMRESGSAGKSTGGERPAQCCLCTDIIVVLHQNNKIYHCACQKLLKLLDC
jgi:hypothetical protein